MAIQVDKPPLDREFTGWINWLVRSVYERIKNGPFALESYAVANVPNAALYEGYMIYISDESGGKVPAFSDGTNWRRTTDRVIIS